MWAALVESAPGFVLLLNRDYVCVYASGGTAELLGGTPAEMVGTRPEAWLEADQLPYVWQTRVAVAAGTQGAVTRIRVPGPDRTGRWLEITSTLVEDPETSVAYTAVHARDITGEIEVQAALSRSEQRYRALLAVADEAVVQIDAHLRIESFNAQALALLGRTAEELLGMPAFGVLDLRDAEGHAITAGESGGSPGADAREPGVPSGLPLPLARLSGGLVDSGWFTVARPQGGRRLVRIRVATYPGPTPADSGYLLVFFGAATRGSGAMSEGPTRRQLRSAAGLTAREGDVLDGLAAGGDVPTIARQLGISVHSVRGHVKSITAKLRVHSQLQAVITAARRGMIDLSEGTSPPS